MFSCLKHNYGDLIKLFVLYIAFSLRTFFSRLSNFWLCFTVLSLCFSLMSLYSCLSLFQINCVVAAVARIYKL